ncbi:MAG: hypothetical protein K0R68_35 [Mycobacterium sp.]|jgi:hypothetical protein|nr:hypothetical protein [Mycobacterium sp.]
MSDVPSSLRDNLRATTRMLLVPQGFTLSVSGACVALTGQRGYSGLLPIWLFLLGAGVSFALCALISGAHRTHLSHEAPSAGAAVFNLAPLVVVPLSISVVGVVGDDRLAFFACGALTVGAYTAAAATFFFALARYARYARSRSVGREGVTHVAER